MIHLVPNEKDFAGDLAVASPAHDMRSSKPRTLASGTNLQELMGTHHGLIITSCVGRSR